MSQDRCHVVLGELVARLFQVIESMESKSRRDFLERLDVIFGSNRQHFHGHVFDKTTRDVAGIDEREDRLD